MNSCNQQGLKSGVLMVNRVGWDRGLTKDTVLLLEKRQANSTWSRQYSNKELKNTWDTLWGDYLLFLQLIPEKQHSQRCLSGNRVAGWCHFPTL